MYYLNLIDFLAAKAESTDPEDTIEAVCSSLHEVPVAVVRSACDYMLQCLAHGVCEIPIDDLMARIERVSCFHGHAHLYR